MFYSGRPRKLYPISQTRLRGPNEGTAYEEGTCRARLRAELDFKETAEIRLRRRQFRVPLQIRGSRVVQFRAVEQRSGQTLSDRRRAYDSPHKRCILVAAVDVIRLQSAGSFHLIHFRKRRCNLRGGPSKRTGVHKGPPPARFRFMLVFRSVGCHLGKASYVQFKGAALRPRPSKAGWN